VRFGRAGQDCGQETDKNRRKYRGKNVGALTVTNKFADTKKLIMVNEQSLIEVLVREPMSMIQIICQLLKRECESIGRTSVGCL
jgi:hypothetical protein